MQICSKRTVRQKKEFAIFDNFVNFGCHNNYLPRLLYPTFSFKQVRSVHWEEGDNRAGTGKSSCERTYPGPAGKEPPCLLRQLFHEPPAGAGPDRRWLILLWHSSEGQKRLPFSPQASETEEQVHCTGAMHSTTDMGVYFDRCMTLYMYLYNMYMYMYSHLLTYLH